MKLLHFLQQIYHNEYTNQNYLETIMTNLDLDVEVMKMHPNYENLVKLGKIN